MEFPGFPAYPTNGGQLDPRTPQKIGKWAWQPKVDDWHGIIHVPTLRVWSQYGRPSSIAHKFTAALNAVPQVFEWLDVGLMNNRHDMMRGCIIVFDFIPRFTRSTYAERRKLLEEHLEIMPLATELLANGTCHDRVFLINQFLPENREEEIALYRTLQIENATLGKKFYEGLISKRADKPYPIQTRKPKDPTPWMIKHRFDQ